MSKVVDLAAKEPYFTQRCEYSDIEQDSKRMLVVQDVSKGSYSHDKTRVVIQEINRTGTERTQ